MASSASADVGVWGTSDLPYPCLKTLLAALTCSDSCRSLISVLRSPGTCICLNQSQSLACPSCIHPQLVKTRWLTPSARTPFPQLLAWDFLHSPHALDQMEFYLPPTLKSPVRDFWPGLPKESAPKHWLTSHPLALEGQVLIRSCTTPVATDAVPSFEHKVLSSARVGRAFEATLNFSAYSLEHFLGRTAHSRGSSPAWRW